MIDRVVLPLSQDAFTLHGPVGEATLPHRHVDPGHLAACLPLCLGFVAGGGLKRQSSHASERRQFPSETRTYPRFSTVSKVRIAATRSSAATQTQGARFGLTSITRKESLASS